MARRITSEYKRECAELVIKYGYKHQDAGDAMGVGLSPIQRWVSQSKQEQTRLAPKVSAITAEQQRIQELEKQVKPLQSDNQRLKKRQPFSLWNSMATTSCVDAEKGWIPRPTDLSLSTDCSQQHLLSFKT